MIPTPEREAHADAAIEALYRAYSAALLAYLARLVSDHGTAEDLCHETFLKALRAWDQHVQLGNARAWLFRIATNSAYDYLRRRRRLQFARLDETTQPPSGTDSMESRLHAQAPVQQVLAHLSPQARLLLLCIDAGHSAPEIAAALECSDTAVRLRLFRARARFRQIYRSIEGDS
jgi:RNA polymerase sigma-70 factor (ECF subfamily)